MGMGCAVQRNHRPGRIQCITQTRALWSVPSAPFGVAAHVVVVCVPFNPGRQTFDGDLLQKRGEQFRHDLGAIKRRSIQDEVR